MTESLSETSKVALGKEVSSLDISPQFDAYSGVEIIVTDEISYFAGNRTGRVLSIQNPWGTQAQATTILNALKAKGFQYQPFTAEGAILNPAAEIGDGITISDTYSGLYKIDRKYSPLMSADVQAPQDEELDHEYPYEPKQDRIYKREIAEANAQIGLTADAITAEVSRATTAEGTKLNHTRTNSTFGWKLTADSFTINKSGSQNVFTANSSGIVIQGNATVTGKIQATSGFIGSSAANGFTITSTAIYNGKTSRTDANNGIYIGKDGIALGANSAFAVTSAGAVTAKNLTITGGSINLGNGVFQVNSNGSVTATNLNLNGGSINLKNSSGATVFSVNNGNVSAVNMNLSGTLTVGGNRITAANLYTGAAQAASGYSGWNSTKNTVSANSGTWSTGAGYGYAFNNACNSGSGVYPSFFKATSLYCSSLYASDDVYVNRGGNISMGRHYHSLSVDGGTIKIGQPSNQQGSFNIADTQFYKDGVESAYYDGYSGVYISSVRRSGQAYSDHVNVSVKLSNGASGVYSVFF